MMDCGIPTREDDGLLGTRSAARSGVGSLRARTTGRNPPPPPTPPRGIPTREDDGSSVTESSGFSPWDPYARGRRDRDRCRTLGAAVGSPRARTTGRCRTVITPL